MKINRRKKVVIEREFQMKFAGYMLLIGLTFGGVFFSVTSAFFWHFARKASALGLSPDSPFFGLLSEQQNVLNWLLLVAGAILLAVVAIYSTFLSNRIAGPIYRLRQYLKASSGGATPAPFKIRNGDFFPDLADDVNAFMSATQGAPKAEATPKKASHG